MKLWDIFKLGWNRPVPGRYYKEDERPRVTVSKQGVMQVSPKEILESKAGQEAIRKTAALEALEPAGGIMSDLKARAELWEANEYIIVIGPVEGTQKAWSWGSPIGPTLSKNAALAVERWLNAGALREIVQRTREES